MNKWRNVNHDINWDGEIQAIDKHSCDYLCDCENEFVVFDDLYGPGGTECENCGRIYLFEIKYNIKERIARNP